jgi:peptidoglycan/LPS O-acetylase OafA/YrhL
MKKSILAIIVSVLVLVTTIIWFTKAVPGNVGEYLQFGVILIIVLFGLYVGYRRLSSEKLGQPAEDEFSKKVMQKAAALSYYISLYLWLVIMYLTDRLKAETDVMFGWGILGMAVIFGGSWVYFNFIGIKND